MPDAVEAVRQDMKQEAPDELRSRQGHDPRPPAPRWLHPGARPTALARRLLTALRVFDDTVTILRVLYQTGTG